MNGTGLMDPDAGTDPDSLPEVPGTTDIARTGGLVLDGI